MVLCLQRGVSTLHYQHLICGSTKFEPRDGQNVWEGFPPSAPQTENVPVSESYRALWSYRHLMLWAAVGLQSLRYLYRGALNLECRCQRKKNIGGDQKLQHRWMCCFLKILHMFKSGKN